MTNILIAGLINLETTLRVDGFPIHYEPVRYPFWGVQSSVSGVGYNVAKALSVLGHTVQLLALIGQDDPACWVRETLAAVGIPDEGVLAHLTETPASVILYDKDGRRKINVDLKDLQEHAYPQTHFETALADAELAVLCNVNFSRRFLKRARELGIPVATDVHAISDLHDEYNADFMAAADLLFLSDERLPTSPERFARDVMACYEPEILVVGLGAEGALLAVRETGTLRRLPAVHTREVVNTIGAGDALFSAFVHGYVAGWAPIIALRRAMIFASYKIGAKGAADGFLTEAELLCRARQVQSEPWAA
jgi:ribokinase